MRWLLYAMAMPCFSLPAGALFTEGQGEIHSPEQNALEVHAADNSIIHWDTFDIASQESVSFALPSENSALLNRVMGGARSEIFGRISSNGQIILINPNGILVGKEACIDTAGWIASTFDLQDKTFLETREWRFAGSARSPIEIEGTIRAPKISLFGDSIALSGNLIGESINVGDKDSSFISVTRDAKVETPRDGRVIFLSGKDLDFWGNVNCPNGFVEVSAHRNLGYHGLVDTDKTGMLLLDPNEIDIVLGGAGTTNPAPFAAFYNGSPAVSATVASADLIMQLGLSNVTIQTNNSIAGGSGNITLHPGATISWASGTNLLLQADQSILLYDSLLPTGPGSQVALFATHGDIVVMSNFAGSAAQAQIVATGLYPVGTPSIILQAVNGSLTMIAADNLETKIRSDNMMSSGDIQIAAHDLNFTAADATTADANTGIQNGRGDIYLTAPGSLNFTSGTGIAAHQANANIVTGLSGGGIPAGGDLFFSVGSLHFDSTLSTTGVQGAASITAYGNFMGAGFGNIQGTVAGDALFLGGFPNANGSGISSLFSGNIDISIRGDLTMVANSGPSMAFCGTGIRALFSLPGQTADVNVAIGGSLIAISGGGIDAASGFGSSGGNVSVAVAGPAIFEITNGTMLSGKVLFSDIGSIRFAAQSVSFNGNGTTPLPALISAQTDIAIATTGDCSINFGSLVSTTGSISIASGGSINMTSGTSLQADQEILAIADRNIELLSGTVQSTTSQIIFVVDNAFPSKPFIGPGAFITNPSTLAAPLGISIYTAQRGRNSISGTTFNGAPFVPGAMFVNTAEEVWCTYYPGGISTFPFTIFYKDCQNLVAYQANLIGSELLRDLHPYDEAWGWYERFTWTRDEYTEPHMIHRRKLMFDLPKSWTTIVNHP